MYRTCGWQLTLNLLKTTIVAPPSNASKWQMGFNSAFKGLKGIKGNPALFHLRQNATTIAVQRQEQKPHHRPILIGITVDIT